MIPESSEREMQEGIKYLAGKLKITDLKEFSFWSKRNKLHTANLIEKHIESLEDWKWLESFTKKDIPLDDFLNPVLGYKKEVLDWRSLKNIARLNTELDRRSIYDYYHSCGKWIEQADDKIENKFEGKLGDSIIYARHDFPLYIDSEWKYNALDIISNEVGGKSMPIDRTETLPTAGIKTSYTPIPDIPNNFSKSLEYILDERAVELWNRGKPIDLFWSGGIDSTAALVALLRTMPLDGIERFKVILSIKSYDEYPLFFEKFIYQKFPFYFNQGSRASILEDYNADNYFDEHFINFNTWVGEYINIASDDILFVSGFCADMVFRGDHYRGPNIWINQDYYELEFSMKPEDYLSHGKFKPFIDEIETFNKKCPTEIKNLNDMLWWWQFATTWHTSQYEMSVMCDNPVKVKNTFGFFDFDDFQIWGLTNPNERDYNKRNMKDYIYTYTKDALYRDNKIKSGSLQTTLGNALGIDNKHNVISFGATSTNKYKMKIKYGNKLNGFRDK